MGWPVEDVTTYTRKPTKGILLQHIQQVATLVEPGDERPGDILVFWIRSPLHPQHVGLLTTGGRMIHTHARVGKVVETHIGDSWGNRLHSVWRFQWQQ